MFSSHLLELNRALKISRFLLFAVFWIAIHSSSSAQIARFEHITTEAGISYNTINAIEKDNAGFMWFGTDNGLNRYDGYQFKIYNHNPSDSTSLSDNRINGILKDKDGDLWIATLNGLNLYHKKHDHFQQFLKTKNQENSLMENPVSCLFQDSRGIIYIGNNVGSIQTYHKKTGTFRAFPFPDKNPDFKFGRANIEEIVEDKKGNLIIGTSLDGLWYYDYNLKKISLLQVFLRDNEDNKKPLKRIRSLRLDDNQTLWISTMVNGVITFNLHSKETRYFTKENSKLKSNFMVCSEKAGHNMWVGTDGGGLYKFNTSTFEVEVFNYDPGNPYSINNNVVRTIYADEIGNIWLGTYTGGVNLLKKSFKEFGAVDLGKYSTDELSYQSCLSFYERSNGNFWIGTDGGGIVETNDKFQPVKFISKNEGYPTGISHNAVITVHEHGQFLWAGTYLGGLNKINLTTGHTELYTREKDQNRKISHNIIWDIKTDKAGTLWVGTNSGLNRYNPKTQSFKAYYPGSYESNSVKVICPDASGHLWLGTQNGLFYYDFKEFQQFAPPTLKDKDFKIRSIYQDKNDMLWLGTHNIGLFRFDPKEKSFKGYSTEDGLPNNIIVGIQEDENGNLWISTGNGLSRFNPKHNTFKNYFIHDGLQNNQFNNGADLKTGSGKLLFGGINGFNVFHPDSISYNPNPPPVSITSFKIFNKEKEDIEQHTAIYNQNIITVDTINLNYDHSVFTFDFAALNYSNPNLISYAYKLEGFDSDWQYVGSKNSATYTNLSPKTYIFRVKAANSDGIWNEKGKSVIVIVKPPYWATVWFRLGLATVVLLTIFWFYQKKSKDIARKHTELEKKVEERTTEVTAQKDEISKQNTILQENKEQLNQQYLELQSTLEKLKKAQSQIIQSEKLASLGVLTAGIAHEINNPVNYINNGIVGLKKVLDKIIEVSEKYDEINQENFAKQLEDIQQFKEQIRFSFMLKKAKEVADNIALGGTKTAEIVQSLRTFSRSEAPDFKLENLHHSIDSTLLLLNNEYKNRIVIHKKYGKIPEIECNLGRLGQVFMNLISNAIHSIENEGEITISTTGYNGLVEIGIKDNGCGIPQHIKEKIFEPFFTTKDIGQGMGLGLSITLNIIKEHQGEIDVYSKENEGTQFLIKLPVKQV
ncbi:two-component regulator propeller domain-containing protein [Flexithrix dorotheae]|uniref:two-component regulator propeller domain-containing protein n=1 Tax=Flexithrix dorotheae TaxID=70993 RepID=UPI0003A63021|nr:two-component regulator propeller domain-containing protein [Flexithrix dorotheae]